MHGTQWAWGTASQTCGCATLPALHLAWVKSNAGQPQTLLQDSQHNSKLEKNRTIKYRLWLLGHEREGWRRRWIGREKRDESSEAPGKLVAAKSRTTDRVHPFFCLEAMICVYVWGQQEGSFFSNPFCKCPCLVIPLSGLQAGAVWLGHGNPIPWAALKQMRFQLEQILKPVKFLMDTSCVLFRKGLSSLTFCQWLVFQWNILMRLRYLAVSAGVSYMTL